MSENYTVESDGIFELQEIKCEKIGERYFRFKHKSGLRVIVYPKKFSTYYASLCVRFGSDDEHVCRINEEKESFSDGIAHFLEHKLFEKSGGGDAFEDFAALGGNGNAYTTKDYTSYLFSCTENFNENLEVLLSFVLSPYFTDENVKKEVGIIAEEIKMYDDNPSSRLYHDMLSCLYKDNPVKKNICGSIESINKITPKMLYECYHTFYKHSNMYLVVCGDTTANSVAQTINAVFDAKNKENEVAEELSSYEFVKANVSELPLPYITESKTVMDISIPSVVIAFKCDGTLTAHEKEKRTVAYNILSDMLFGKSSDFYYKMYCDGLTDGGIYLEYEYGCDFAYSSIALVTKKPNEAIDSIRKYLEKQRREPIGKREFERIKKTAWAEYIRDFDSTEEIAESVVSSEAYGLSVFDEVALIDEMNYDYILKIINEDIKEDRMTVSILLPKGESKC